MALRTTSPTFRKTSNNITQIYRTEKLNLRNPRIKDSSKRILKEEISKKDRRSKRSSVRKEEKRRPRKRL